MRGRRAILKPAPVPASLDQAAAERVVEGTPAMILLDSLIVRRAAVELAIRSVDGTQMGGNMDEVLARAMRFEDYLTGNSKGNTP